jgi:hypothetical protein
MTGRHHLKDPDMTDMLHIVYKVPENNPMSEIMHVVNLDDVSWGLALSIIESEEEKKFRKVYIVVVISPVSMYSVLISCLNCNPKSATNICVL